jgi:hypothetical protein
MLQAALPRQRLQLGSHCCHGCLQSSHLLLLLLLLLLPLFLLLLQLARKVRNSSSQLLVFPLNLQ